MSASGQVFITIVDGAGAVAVVPAISVQAVIGWAKSGTPNVIVATQSPPVLAANFTTGPLPEAAALTCLAGGTVLAVPVALTSPGTATGVVPTSGNTSASVMTVTLDATNGAYDDYFVKIKVQTGGTVGTAGCYIQISLDAGRTYGQPIALGTATTYTIPNTGITLHFTAASLVAGDTFTFGTTGPIVSDAAIQGALQALDNSQYGVTGWGGGTHLVGNIGTSTPIGGGVLGADVQTIEGYLDGLATNKTFTRAIVAARDASPPAAYGGAGESETSWITSLQADQSAVSAVRVMQCAAHWNMPSAFNNASAGTPRFRRNLAWALAARAASVDGPQRHLGRVLDGPLSTIVVDPVGDANDGFIYHNEQKQGGLDYKFTGTGARYATSCLRKRKPGVFNTNPLLSAPFGSNFWMWPFGQVMDVASALMDEVGTNFVNNDIRLTSTGSIDPRDAATLQSALAQAVNQMMFNAGMLSAKCTVTINLTNNVQTSGNIIWYLVINGKGYVLQETGTIAYANPNAAS